MRFINIPSVWISLIDVGDRCDSERSRYRKGESRRRSEIFELLRTANLMECKFNLGHVDRNSEAIR